MKKLAKIFLMLMCVNLVFCACTQQKTQTDVKFSPAELADFSREIQGLDMDTLSYVPFEAQYEVQPRKAYTIMVYMNGSDLESDYSAATIDLIEILDSGVDTDICNVIIFSGGALRWNNNLIPPRCCIWQVEGNKLAKICDLGFLDMGNSGTLGSFLSFCQKYFPAQKSGLILWDHAGGSIAGFGDDQIFDGSHLSLLELNLAFEKSIEQPLEFVGFDACLMATIETAIIAQNYFKFLIASQDLEPGQGWDYSFLSQINTQPQIGGGDLGVYICDYFFAYYGIFYNAQLTLSVVDLSKCGEVMQAMGTLAQNLNEQLAQKSVGFEAIKRARHSTKTFGIGSPRDNQSDMVDILDMAEQHFDFAPRAANILASCLRACVIYSRHNSKVNLGGLSCFYIYGNQQNGKSVLNVYQNLHMQRDYTLFLQGFFRYLSKTPTTRAPIPATGDGYRNAIFEGKPVQMCQIAELKNSTLYALPVKVDGKDTTLVILFDNFFPQGKVLGIRQSDHFLIQKGFEKVQFASKLQYQASLEMRCNGYVA